MPDKEQRSPERDDHPLFARWRARRSEGNSVDEVGAAVRALARVTDPGRSWRTPVDDQPADTPESLRDFNRHAPWNRVAIAAFVREAARGMEPGTKVVDVGAGTAPYRCLFAHTDYVTVDWEHSIHRGADSLDYLSTAESLPFDEGTFDAVLLTEVLEHVEHPPAVLKELARVLKPGGRLWMTVPFVNRLHEMPYDFWRFTPPALRMLLDGAGFADVEIEGRTDYFTTLAHLMASTAIGIGAAEDGRDQERQEAAEALARLAPVVAALGPLEADRSLPLGWSVVATRRG